MSIDLCCFSCFRQPLLGSNEFDDMSADINQYLHCKAAFCKCSDWSCWPSKPFSICGRCWSFGLFVDWRSYIWDTQVKRGSRIKRVWERYLLAVTFSTRDKKPVGDRSRTLVFSAQSLQGVYGISGNTGYVEEGEKGEMLERSMFDQRNVVLNKRAKDSVMTNTQHATALLHWFTH